MNKVITVSREFGSGGREFGRRLAEELGYQYYDNEVLTQMVQQTELSENYIREVVHGKTQRLMPITVEHTFIVGCDYNLKQIQDIYKAQTDVIRDMATKSDCVIVGRCADYILKDVEDIELIRLFVYADFESRVQRCMDKAKEGEGLDYKQMKKYVQKVDKGRSGYYEDYTLQKWGAKENYDLCVNSTNMNISELAPYFAKMFQ